MTAERHRLVSHLFLQVWELPMPAREQVLREACKEDPTLFDDVRALLDAHDSEPVETDSATIWRRAIVGEDGPLAMPKRIGRYDILDELGVGGMGTVYRGRSRFPDREVALKIIRQGLLSDAAIDSFEHEVQVLGRLRHPGIAQIYEAGTFETALGAQPFLAMELVEGPPLREYVRQHRLTVRQRLGVFVRICDAVHHAHLHGVVHRDLKPSNILIERDRQPKILDFGIALAARHGEAREGLPREEPVGTFEYMSPEQAAGDGNFDPRSDVYSLGVLLFELLCDTVPLDLTDMSRAEALEVVQRRELRSPVQCGLRDRDLAAVLERALSRSLTARYQSASELAADVRRYLRDEPLQARPHTARYLAAKFAKRNKVLVGSAALLFLTVTVAAVAGFTLFFEKVLAESERDRFGRFKDLATFREDWELSAYWPSRPPHEPDFALKIAEARGLLAELPEHEATLRRWREGGTEDKWWDVQSLQALVHQLQPPLEELARCTLDVLGCGLVLEESPVRDFASLVRAYEQALELCGSRGPRTGFEARSLEALLDELRSDPRAAEPGRLVHLHRRRLEVWRAEERQTSASFARLEELLGAQPTLVELLADLERRRATARELVRATIVEPVDAWRAAAEHARRSPHYRGLELFPQLGLVPLGPDPQSGLLEFWYWESGERPVESPWTATDPTRRVWNVEPETGLVLILVPGGSFEMGYDFASEIEDGSLTVQLDPYFLSKYEMTQGQWVRSDPWARNPSAYYANMPEDWLVVTASHPVDSVSYDEGMRMMERLGLTLPTEAQWEYAAGWPDQLFWPLDPTIPGADFVWTGQWNVPFVCRLANLKDGSYLRMESPNALVDDSDSGWIGEDGFPVHAPVGRFPPSLAGFHDLIGNVSEWCGDKLVFYTVSTVRNGSGERLGEPVVSNSYVVRGGSFRDFAGQARTHSRDAVDSRQRSPVVGLRPARPLHPHPLRALTGWLRRALAR